MFPRNWEFKEKDLSEKYTSQKCVYYLGLINEYAIALPSPMLDRVLLMSMCVVI
jgi:hypothetical protein